MRETVDLVHLFLPCELNFSNEESEGCQHRLVVFMEGKILSYSPQHSFSTEMFNIQSNKPSGFSLVNVSFRFIFFMIKTNIKGKLKPKSST